MNILNFMIETTHTLSPDNWVKLYADLLYRYALAKVSKEEVAEDLVQETFLAALKATTNYKGETSEKNWLFSILKHKIIDYYRKKKELLSVDAQTDSGGDLYGNFFDEHEHWAKNAAPTNWGIHADNKMETKEFYNIFELCKKKLVEIQNAVFSMKYVDDMNSEEICKELGITSSNYWVLIHRAKLQLRACLEKNWLKA